jgi:hypothetical protein
MMLFRLTITLIMSVALHSNSIVNAVDWGGSPMEEKLETQIDKRPPKSFPYFENLVTRQRGFSSLTHDDGNGNKITSHVNWETYTLRYWYETRVRNAACPMEPIGIAAATDWSLMCTCLFGDTDTLPRTIFVHTYMLSHFYESTLKFMDKSARFILYTGGTDMTIPEGSGDVRYGAPRWFGAHSQGWESMVKDPRIVHWFAENHDISHPKLSTLPTGFTEENYYKPLPDGQSYPSDIKALETYVLLDKRPLTVLHADRIRDGRGQMATRAEVEAMCKKIDWCIQPFEIDVSKGDHPDADKGVSHDEYLGYLADSPFIACVHGGGIDPSPKAFEALMRGTIPIVKRSVLYDSYSQFPVAWVDDWKDLFEVGEEKRVTMMKAWIKELMPYFVPGSALRRQVLDKMRTSHWIEEGHKRLEQQQEQQKEKEKEKEQEKEQEKEKEKEKEIPVPHLRNVDLLSNPGR